ncbi:hypothetical protein BT96DRAFT_422157 [Gymnopus androsaceus JB14]|uniref:Uncharacterized protein n=1 Tax=Gymnopus androsaceus JB14 TaxID=1447944 RepID=A0A6A4GSH9_9AGAR|nr:hypothetical protein BT96DRAFT_422157 [Gymnopus androsaceus JB14]
MSIATMVLQTLAELGLSSGHLSTAAIAPHLQPINSHNHSTTVEARLSSLLLLNSVFRRISTLSESNPSQSITHVVLPAMSSTGSLELRRKKHGLCTL